MHKIVRFLLSAVCLGYLSAAVAEPDVAESSVAEPVSGELVAGPSAVEPVATQGLGYTFISADHVQYEVKIDGVAESLEGSGLSLDFSVALRPHVALIASFSRSRASVFVDGVQFNAKIDSTLVGLVIHAAINDTTDFIIGTGFINGKANVTNSDDDTTNSADADGGMVMIGIRALLHERLEVSGFVRKTAIEESTRISLSFSAGYYVDETVSLDLSYVGDTDDGSKLWTWGVTKYF